MISSFCFSLSTFGLRPELMLRFMTNAVQCVVKLANFTTHWTAFVMNLNMSSGRNPNVDKLKQKLEIMYSEQYPLDGEFYQERSAWPRLDKIGIPSYFGSGW